MKRIKSFLLIVLAVFMVAFCAVVSGCKGNSPEYEEAAGTYYFVKHNVCDQEDWIKLFEDKTWTDSDGLSGEYTLTKFTDALSTYEIDLKIEEESLLTGVLSGGVLNCGGSRYMTGDMCQREGISGCYVTVENALYSINGTSVEFGRFPQTIKDENVTLTNVPDGEGYYQDSDGNDYVKVQAKVSTSWSDYTLDYTNRQEIVEGEYYYFKVEPLKWSLLQEEDGVAFLWCRNIVWAMQFQSQFTVDENASEDATCKYFVTNENASENTPANNYYYSEVREWLNDDFYNMAFTDEEKEIIVVDTVNNGRESVEPFWNSTRDEFLCENTTDSVFLLSEGEIRNRDYGFSHQVVPDNGYASEATKRIRSVTDYAKATGISFIPREVASSSAVYQYGAAMHMMRTPADGSLGDDVVTATENSWIVSDKIDETIGVVPAIRLDLTVATSGLKMAETEDKSGYIVFGVQDKTLKKIIIPSEVNGKPVKEISGNAFAECTVLETLVIPSCVEKLGENAFNPKRVCVDICMDNIKILYTSSGSGLRYSNALKSMIIRGGEKTKLEELDDDYFMNLENLVIGKGILSINSYAFREFDKLTSVTIGNSVTSIGEFAFCDCDNLTSVVIGDSVISIGGGAFEHCYRLVEVANKSPHITVEKGSTSNGYVGAYALAVYNSTDTFTGTKLSNDNGYIVYTDGEEKILVKYVGDETDLTLPSYLTQINRYAFKSYDSLTSVVIGDGVKSIGGYAFYNCDNLTSVVIGDSVESIGEYAFCDCDNLTNIVIPDSVMSIGNRAFSRCSNLTSIEIPDSVRSIGSYAFYNCGDLTSVVIGDSVTSIGNTAFGSCPDLMSVVIGDSVTSIGDLAFYGCPNLTSVYYKGTASEWNEITISNSDRDFGNGDLTSATRYYYIENEADVPTDDGNYWHYVDGVPTAW